MRVRRNRTKKGKFRQKQPFWSPFAMKRPAQFFGSLFSVKFKTPRKAGKAEVRKAGSAELGGAEFFARQKKTDFCSTEKQGAKKGRKARHKEKGLEGGAKARRKKTEEGGQSRRNQKTPARCFGKAFALCFFCTRFRRFSDCQRERRTAKAAGIFGRNGRAFFVPFTALPAPPKLAEGRAKKSRNRENYRARRSKIFPSRSFQRSSPPSNTA